LFTSIISFAIELSSIKAEIVELNVEVEIAEISVVNKVLETSDTVDDSVTVSARSK